MKVASGTDTGRARDHNEDNIMVDDRRNIFLLADGMGGHKAGEMASKMAIEIVYESLKNDLADAMSPRDVTDVMQESVLSAHEVIKLSSSQDFSYSGMGTTLIAAFARANIFHICHVGDSRVYHIRNRIRQITKDQTWGDYLVHQEKIPKEKVPKKYWHALRQAIGKSDHIEPEIHALKLAEGDILLMCSDGLTDMVKEKEIESIVMENQEDNFEDTVNILIRTANKNGGRDNISVILVKYQDSYESFWRTPFSF